MLRRGIESESQERCHVAAEEERGPGITGLSSLQESIFGVTFPHLSLNALLCAAISKYHKPEILRNQKCCSAFGNEEQPPLKPAPPSKDTPKGTGRAAPTPSSNAATPRRSLLPAPKSTSMPAGTKKEAQKDPDANKPAVSSPKRTAASSTKLHSPGYPKQRTTASRNGITPKPDLQAREAERQLAQRLRDRCEWQARQLGLARGELKKAIRGFDALAVSTQHFFGKDILKIHLNTGNSTEAQMDSRSWQNGCGSCGL
ncbi:putative microtubule-associated tumor suppressor candidate 2 like protein [Cricetulus griseus]|nr:putative microtubule-associated tumor suppressor candidate 2 like protein [Cricetulus griseus]